ncbi:Arsenical resistance operon repressor [hydrothermal vent metagenome]|uniref:Arsenical resistance operon repressor n=1 Tax=hydrothermal vent metagenome TaxID=652676 RepID=A0A3B0RH78_9ZZZZ
MDIDIASQSLAALSQRTRLDAFRLLIKAGDKGLAAGDVSDQLGVVQNTMSAHLANLAQAGLVRRKRQSRVIRYYANFAQMRDLIGFLLEDCCGGQPELCGSLLDEIACLATPESEGANAKV